MKLRFDEEKTTQAAARFLDLRGGSMSYLKLLKLLYLADRAALLRWGKPISMDRYLSMKHGPVLSNVYSLIVEDHRVDSIWSRHISAPSNYEVRLLTEDYPSDRLSPAEERLVDEIFEQFGALGRWELVEYLHGALPEWKNPGESSVPIPIREILATELTDDAEIAAIEEELSSFAGSRSRIA